MKHSTEDTPIGTRESGSFRDPYGYVFISPFGILQRAVFPSAYSNLDLLLSSGLYKELVGQSLLVSHHEQTPPEVNPSVRLLTPELIPFISYPYEWSFGQLQAAAQLTLEVQKIALEHDMTLRDASAFNVQFKGFTPCFIDTLSFEALDENAPWKAYRQFCRNFIAPLLTLAYYPDFRGLWLSHIDGFELKCVSSLLPLRTWAQLGPLFHIHLHALAEINPLKASTHNKTSNVTSSKAKQFHLVESLIATIKAIKPRRKLSHWSSYYATNTYSTADFEVKKNFVLKHVEQLKPKLVWDFGANTGHFSFEIAKFAQTVIALEYEADCVTTIFEKTKSDRVENIVPLVQNLLNSTPSLGWGNKERKSLKDRGPADLGLALALIHHLCLDGNVPLVMIAADFAALCRHLIIEFVDPTDVRAAQLLERKPSLKPRYTLEKFEAAFAEFFNIVETTTLESRKLYFLSAK
jgi:hypothetical protein